jgi:hypothetical protein
LEHLDVVVRHDEEPGAARDEADDVALRREVLRVVVVDLVLVDAHVVPAELR